VLVCNEAFDLFLRGWMLSPPRSQVLNRFWRDRLSYLF
jgi:hypothetical protein